MCHPVTDEKGTPPLPEQRGRRTEAASQVGLAFFRVGLRLRKRTANSAAITPA